LDFGSNKTIVRYDLTAVVAGDQTRAPKTWTFEGSPDGTTFTVLDTQTNASAWGDLEKRTFTFANTTGYRYYRLNVTACEGVDVVEVVQLSMFTGLAAELQINAPTTTNDYFLKTNTGKLYLGASSALSVLASTGAIEMASDLSQTNIQVSATNGINGATIQNTGNDFVDQGFLPNSGSGNIGSVRWEHRGGSIIGGSNSGGEFQYFLPGGTAMIVGIGSAGIPGSTKFGIGTAVPAAQLEVVGASLFDGPAVSSFIYAVDVGSLTVIPKNVGKTSDYLVNVSSSSNVLMFGVQNNGHVVSSGTTPSPTSCGSSPVITGTDFAFTVAPGSGATGCTIPFVSAFLNDPVCMVKEETMSLVNAMTYTHSASQVVITQTGASSEKYDVICIGNKG